MKLFKIEYVETTHGYFGVEAETEEEALYRFGYWKANDDYVYDMAANFCDIDVDYFVNDDAHVFTEDILTDKEYQNLIN